MEGSGSHRLHQSPLGLAWEVSQGSAQLPVPPAPPAAPAAPPHVWLWPVLAGLSATYPAPLLSVKS